jgi:predicted nucleic acid-binding Zn ribbon protein
MLPIQEFSTRILAEIIRRQPASKERTRFVWQIVAGATLARVTKVDLVDGTLTVTAADDRWLTEIRRARQTILERLQHLLGPDAVTRLEITLSSTHP